MKIETIKSLDEIYKDPALYSNSNSTFSPPSEKLGHVIRFELTTGCSWNGCTFCGGYKGMPYKVKSFGEYKENVDKVWEKIGKRSNLANTLERIFIGGGDALSVDTELLKKAIRYTENSFTRNVGTFFEHRYPKRLAVYERTKSILEKGKKGFKQVKKERMFGEYNGLNLIYWGIESGSNEVLDYVNKGCSGDDVLLAGKILNSVYPRIKTSVMIMPGLGGLKFYDKHVKKTAEVLGEIEPEFLTFMGINPSSNSLYSKKNETRRT